MHKYKVISGGYENSSVFYLYHEQEYSEEAFQTLCQEGFIAIVREMTTWPLERFKEPETPVKYGEYYLSKLPMGAPRRFEDLIEPLLLWLIENHGFHPEAKIRAHYAFWGWEDWDKEHFWGQSRYSPTAELIEALQAEGLYDKMHALYKEHLKEED